MSFSGVLTFSTNVPLLYPLKHQKTSGCPFSGGIDVEHWLKMGYGTSQTPVMEIFTKIYKSR